MTDKIDQRLEEIEANVPSTITGSGKCECQACQEKLALCKALRRALKGFDKIKAYPGGVADIAYAATDDIERILSGEEGK